LFRHSNFLDAPTEWVIGKRNRPAAAGQRDAAQAVFIIPRVGRGVRANHFCLRVSVVVLGVGSVRRGGQLVRRVVRVVGNAERSQPVAHGVIREVNSKPAHEKPAYTAHPQAYLLLSLTPDSLIHQLPGGSESSRSPGKTPPSKSRLKDCWVSSRIPSLVLPRKTSTSDPFCRNRIGG